MPNPSYDAMSKVLMNRNKNLRWVQRAFDPNQTSVDNGDGTTSTHKMMSSDIEDGKVLVYPSIIEKDGQLVQLTEDEAADYAFKNKTGIVLPNKQFAKYFENKGYKNASGMNKTYKNGKAPKKKYMGGLANIAGSLAQKGSKSPLGKGAGLLSDIGQATSFLGTIGNNEKAVKAGNIMNNVGSMGTTVNNSFEDKKKEALDLAIKAKTGGMFRKGKGKGKGKKSSKMSGAMFSDFSKYKMGKKSC